jgi:hypothetical protein
MKTTNIHRGLAAGFLWLSLAAVAPAQSTVTVSVPGTANPFLAGMPNGTKCCMGDSAPLESPVEVTGITLKANQVLTFSATGLCNEASPYPQFPPDGESDFIVTPLAVNGIGAIEAPVCALVGVFLTKQKPSKLPAPPPVDFTISPGLDFAGISPGLRQPFFIGDGVTSSGVTQQFIVPPGATRLFLGVIDGSGWYNNSGVFTVVVTAP